MSAICSVALYMVMSSAGESWRFCVLRSAAVVRRPLHRKRREDRSISTSLLPLCCTAQFNCRQGEYPSQELFGAAHHLSGVDRQVKSKRPINQEFIIVISRRAQAVAPRCLAGA